MIALVTLAFSVRVSRVWAPPAPPPTPPKNPVFFLQYREPEEYRETEESGIEHVISLTTGTP